MANFNFNKITLGGRLVADPELRETSNGVAVCNARIAVTRRAFNGNEPESDFFNIVAWRGGAEFLANYFRKGSSVCVSGCLQTSSYEDEDGVAHYNTFVVVDEIYFVDSKADNAEKPANGRGNGRESAGKKPAANNRGKR